MARRISAERARDLLDYDPETGVFRWKVNRGPAISDVPIKFAALRNGYPTLRIDRVPYYAHRVAWLIQTGRWPRRQIDHKDTCKTNLVFGNLREATMSEQRMNQARTKANTSGFKGVSWISGKHRWCAQIKAFKKKYFLGYFDTAEAAHAAYCAKATEIHGEFARAA